VSMRGRERLGNQRGNLQRFRHFQRSACEPVGKGLALQVFHDQVVGAVVASNVVEDANVRMLQGRYGSGFAFKTLQNGGIGRQVRWQNLDSDSTIKPRIARTVYLPHAAGSEERFDLVRSVFRAWAQCHPRPIISVQQVKELTREEIGKRWGGGGRATR